MSNVIEFLEWMGQEASWRQGQPNDIELAIASSNLAPASKAVLISQESRHLEALLEASSDLCCLVHNPDDDEDEEEEEEEEEDEDEDEKIRSVAG